MTFLSDLKEILTKFVPFTGLEEVSETLVKCLKEGNVQKRALEKTDF